VGFNKLTNNRWYSHPVVANVTDIVRIWWIKRSIMLWHIKKVDTSVKISQCYPDTIEQAVYCYPDFDCDSHVEAAQAPRALNLVIRRQSFNIIYSTSGNLQTPNSHLKVLLPRSATSHTFPDSSLLSHTIDHGYQTSWWRQRGQSAVLSIQAGSVRYGTSVNICSRIASCWWLP